MNKSNILYIILNKIDIIYIKSKKSFKLVLHLVTTQRLTFESSQININV